MGFGKEPVRQSRRNRFRRWRMFPILYSFHFVLFLFILCYFSYLAFACLPTQLSITDKDGYECIHTYNISISSLFIVCHKSYYKS